MQTAPPTVAKWSQSAPPLPTTGFVRGVTLWGDKKADPPITGLIPLGRSTILSGIKSGKFKLTPIKLSERTTAYRIEEVRALIDQLSGEVKV